MRQELFVPLILVTTLSCAGVGSTGEEGEDGGPGPTDRPGFDERPITELPMAVVVGFDDTVLFFDGREWAAQDVSGDFEGVYGGSEIGVLVAGSSPTLVHYDGGSWLGVDTGLAGAASIHGTSLDDLWLAYGATVAHYDGVAWRRREVNEGTYTSLTAIWSAGGGEAYAGGVEGCIASCESLDDCAPAEVCDDVLFHFDGRSWSRVEEASGGPDQVWSIWGSADDDVYVVDSSRVLHFDGASWSEAALPGEEPYFSHVWGLSSTDVYVTGSTTSLQVGTVWHFDGASWSACAVEGSRPLYSVHGSEDNGVYAVGIGGGIARETDVEGEFEPMSSPTTAALWGVWVNDAYVERPPY